VGIVIAGYIGAAFFGLVFGTKPVERRAWWRLLGVAAVSVFIGPSTVALVQAIGPLDGHHLALAAAGAFLCFTVGSVAVGLQSALGVVGTGVSILLFVVLGNPSSGGPYATELLPGLWRTLGPYLPTGAGVDLVRNLAYFDGQAIGRPLVVLTAWLALGVAMVGAFARVRPYGLSMKGDRDRERAPVDAQLAAGAS